MVLDVLGGRASFVPISLFVWTDRDSLRVCIWVETLQCEVPVPGVLVLFRFKPRIIRSFELSLRRWCKEGVLEDWSP